MTNLLTVQLFERYTNIYYRSATGKLRTERVFTCDLIFILRYSFAFDIRGNDPDIAMCSD